VCRTLGPAELDRIRGHCETRRASAGSLQSESCAPREAQWAAAFELGGSAPVGVPQTQANCAKFGGMCEDEFARYPERARQFTDGHKRAVFGINHTRRRAQISLPTQNRDENLNAVSATSAEFTQSIFENSALAARRVA
jgi:hypothetical protein